MAALKDPVSVGVGVIVTDEDGRVLLTKRLGDKHGKGEFCFPGGKPDPGEDPGMTAIRELHEEAGIVAYGLRKLNFWSYDRYDGEYEAHYVTAYFICQAEGQTPRNLEPTKHESWEWYYPEDLPDPLFQGTQAAIDFCQRQGEL